jgi:hypothetical protein
MRVRRVTLWVAAAAVVIVGCSGRSGSAAAAAQVPCETPPACQSLVARLYNLHLQLPQQSGLHFVDGKIGPPYPGGYRQNFAVLSYLESANSLSFSVAASQVRPLAAHEVDPAACPDNGEERTTVTPKGRTVCIRSGPITQPENRSLKMTIGSVIYLVVPAVRTAVSPDWLIAVADSFS